MARQRRWEGLWLCVKAETTFPVWESETEENAAFLRRKENATVLKIEWPDTSSRGQDLFWRNHQDLHLHVVGQRAVCSSFKISEKTLKKWSPKSCHRTFSPVSVTISRELYMKRPFRTWGVPSRQIMSWHRWLGLTFCYREDEEEKEEGKKRRLTGGKR